MRHFLRGLAIGAALFISSHVYADEPKQQFKDGLPSPTEAECAPTYPWHEVVTALIAYNIPVGEIQNSQQFVRLLAAQSKQSITFPDGARLFIIINPDSKQVKLAFVREDGCTTSKEATGPFKLDDVLAVLDKIANQKAS